MEVGPGKAVLRREKGQQNGIRVEPRMEVRSLL